ncbi:MAG TPA: hypothetical protein VHF87_02610 [Methylomirabilota bacterium]|nr:hypothetical protein [Methylomirabilota bacterium]
MADPVIEGRSLVMEAIRTLAIACRAWAAYPSDHPNVSRAVSAAQTRVGEMLAAHGSVAIGVGRDHLRVGVWTLESPQVRAIAQALYRRQVAVLRLDRGAQPDELRALLQWLAGPAVPLEPGSPAAGPPGLPGARHLHLLPLDYSAVRLTDRAAQARVEAQGASAPVSLTDRLLNVLLEWGPGEADWGDETGEGSSLPAELAMVNWLRDFLKTQASRERGDPVEPDGRDGATSGEAGPGPGDGRPGNGDGDPGSSAGGEPREGRAAGDRASGAADVSVGSATAVVAGADASGTEGAPVPDEAGIGGGPAPPGVTPPQLLARLTDATSTHLEEMSGAGRALAARQTAQLIMRLPEPLRESLMRAALRVVASDPASEDALQALTSSMTAHPVLRVMRQLAAEGVALSRHAQRLVELLASTRTESAEEEPPAGRDLERLREELLTLFREEDIDRYNPEDHLALLARAMLAWPTRTPVVLGTLDTLGERVGSLTEDAVGRQLAETLLDLLGRYADDKTARVLARVEQLVEGALARGSIEEAVLAIEGMSRLAADEAAPEGTRAATREHIDRLARPETLSVLAASLGATPGPAAVRLVRLLGPGAIRNLLQVLVEEKVRIRRRRIFDLLSALGPDVVPEATRWLGDPNWYVVRNIIALLRAVGDRSSLATVRRLTGHSDLRVRLEALRSLLELDPAVGQEHLLRAVADPDPRAATAAVEVAGQRGGPAMLEPLLGVLAPWDLRGRRRAVRIAALQALGRVGRAEALPRLARFFRERWGPFPALAERRAAFESLQGYPPEARASLALRGLRSRDHEIRTVCERLRSEG